MKRTRRALEESDVALLVVDGTMPRAADDDTLPDALGSRPVIVVRSKADLPAHPQAEQHRGAIIVSSTTGAGVSALLDRLREEVLSAIGDGADEGQVAASLRQVETLDQVAGALRAAAAALPTMPLEVALVDLREALYGTSALLGVELGDAVLDRIFATFCIGK
jgi:tRNA modification GTPase